MFIKDITSYLESLAHQGLQESYDNAGLLAGRVDWACTGVLCCLDVVEAVVDEALAQQCNLIVAHHPIIFGGLKSITGKNHVERTLIKAIKNDIAIYAIHTNLDNVIHGVNGQIALKLGLRNLSVLAPKPGQLRKIYFYVPPEHAQATMNALFETGAGHIGRYSECSFRALGTGTFKPDAGAQPFTGQVGKRHEAAELKIELLYPAHLEVPLLATLQAVHPYEEVAYEVVPLGNAHQQIGAGICGELEEALDESVFLQKVKDVFGLSVIKHTPKRGRPVQKISLCGGAGSFLLKNAIASKSDVYISSDFKYHEFFDADGQILLMDIGHYESEQFTIDLLANLLEQKFPTFAVLKTGINTNPVQYF